MPLVDLELPVLRGEVALVTQEHHVFIGTVRDNVVLAREDSPDDAVWSVVAGGGDTSSSSRPSSAALTASGSFGINDTGGSAFNRS